MTFNELFTKVGQLMHLEITYELPVTFRSSIYFKLNSVRQACDQPY